MEEIKQLNNEVSAALIAVTYRIDLPYRMGFGDTSLISKSFGSSGILRSKRISRGTRETNPVAPGDYMFA